MKDNVRIHVASPFGHSRFPHPAHIISFEDEDKKSNDLNWVIHNSTDSSTLPQPSTVIRPPSPHTHKSQKNFPFHGITIQFLSCLQLNAPVKQTKFKFSARRHPVLPTDRATDRVACGKAPYLVDKCDYHSDVVTVWRWMGGCVPLGLAGLTEYLFSCDFRPRKT